MLKFRRKNHYTEFSTQANRKTVILLSVFFLLGLLISTRRAMRGILSYLSLWILSYPIIYAGTCRNCPYYGKRCPIPFEGSCVQHFFARGNGSFGYAELFWASVTYLIRMLIPLRIILSERLIALGSVYFGIAGAFWGNHFLIEGCPNCINTACPINPDHEKSV
jgi:hypothetical protein